MSLLRSGRRAAARTSFTSGAPVARSKWSSTKTTSSNSASRMFSFGVGLLTAAIGGGAFAAGVAYKSNSPDIDYGRATKFRAPKYASVKEMQKAIQEIQTALRQDSISTDEENLKLHGYSEWSPANIDTLPIAVVYPRSTEEVSKIAKICHGHKIPMIGFSGGSSLEGNYSAPHGGISIDFCHMDKIVAFRDEDMDITVQPSVGWVDLNKKIADSGLFFPVDPSPSAKFGGIIGKNCSGTNAVRYGTMKDWVLNLTVVLADGMVIKTRGRPRKSAAGYNLNGIFVGSEGTLGLVTEATLKLAVIPKEFSIAVVSFPTIREAAVTGSAVMRAGVPVAALEFLDEIQMAINNKGGFTAPKVWKELPTIFFKFSGTKASVADNIREVQLISKTHGCSSFEFAKDKKEQDMLWSARKQALWSLSSLRPEVSN